MAGVSSGFYVPYPGGVWLVEEPANWPAILQGHGQPWSEILGEIVYEHELSAGVTVVGLRPGILKFDFSNYPLALMESDVTTASHFPDLIRATAERVKVLNAFALCLHSAYIDVENRDVGSFWITHENVFHYNSGGHAGGTGIQQLPITAKHKAMTHDTISGDVLDAAASLLDDILCHQHRNTTGLVALLNHAVASHKSHNFELAVVSSWTICEALQNQLWKMYYSGATEGQSAKHPGAELTKKRRGKLEGRDFTASVVSEILGLAGMVTPELHGALDLTRSRRNNWLHGGKAPGMGDSGKSVEVASDMIKVTLGLDIKVGTGIGASGL